MLAARLAPARLLVVGCVVAVAVFVLDIRLACFAPSLGLSLEPAATGQGVVVARVQEPGPAYGTLKHGEVITAINARDGTLVLLNAAMIARTPYWLPTYAAINQVFADHRALWDAINQEVVTLVRPDGTRAVLRPDRHRAVTSLPLDFWAMDLLAALALLIGAGVLAFKPNDAAARMLFVACFGLALAAAMMALFKGRELTLSADWAPLFWATEQFGENLAAPFGLVALLWVYPRRFRSTRYLLPVAGFFFGTWLAGQYQWWPSPAWPPTISTLSFLGLIPLSAWQWQASRTDPVDRAALKILLLALLIPFGALVLASSVPMMLGLQPLISSGLGLACIVLPFYVGLALGVSRYRLFNLDRWWFEALIWGLGGALVLLFDTALIWLNTSAGVALGTAVAVAGWLYFPVRQWLWRRFNPAARQTVERHLPRLITSLFAADSAVALQLNWRVLLEQIYSPLSVSVSELPIATVTVAREGLLLCVPALGDGPALELSHAGKGQRLFNSADAALAAALLALTRQAARARRAQDERAAEQQAHLREKELLLQDLHDGLGGMATNIGMLVTLAQKEQSLAAVQSRLATISELADASLSEIRSFMYSLDDDAADWTALAGDMRAAGRALVEPHGLAFAMEAAISQAAPPPDSLMRLDLARIYKESLVNVVKHAQARQVSVQLGVTASELLLTVQDDGAWLPPQPANGQAQGQAKSRGLTNLHRRAERLGGRLDVGPREDASAAGTVVRLHLPLPTKCPASGDAGAAMRY